MNDYYCMLSLSSSLFFFVCAIEVKHTPLPSFTPLCVTVVCVGGLSGPHVLIRFVFFSCLGRSRACTRACQQKTRDTGGGGGGWGLSRPQRRLGRTRVKQRPPTGRARRQCRKNSPFFFSPKNASGPGNAVLTGLCVASYMSRNTGNTVCLVNCSEKPLIVVP